MSHIHKLYDFVVTIFAVHQNKVLLVYHRNYGKWLPIGGHIELDEDPEDALYREIKEECGLKIRVLSPKPPITHRGVKPLPTPAFVDSHAIRGHHRHIAFIYFGLASGKDVRLCVEEHREFRWFRKSELSRKRFGITKSVRFYARKALDAASETKRRRK